jgi:hypothetical protein
LNFEPRPHEAQLEDQKQKKAQEGHLEVEKITRPTKGTKSSKPKKNDRKDKISSKPK